MRGREDEGEGEGRERGTILPQSNPPTRLTTRHTITITTTITTITTTTPRGHLMLLCPLRFGLLHYRWPHIPPMFIPHRSSRLHVLGMMCVRVIVL